MEKSDKNVKKTVIRNVKQPLSSTGTVASIKSTKKMNKADIKTTKTLNIPQLNLDRKSSKTDNTTTTTTLDAPQLNSDRKTNKPATSLSVPELNSTLGIARKIDSLRNQTKTTTTHLTSEMLTRKLNFAYEQRVYKDLVPLQTTKTSQQQHTVTREPLRFRDKEPQLGEFIETTHKNNEYFYRPSVVRKPVVNNRADFDSLKLYRILNSN